MIYSLTAGIQTNHLVVKEDAKGRVILSKCFNKEELLNRRKATGRAPTESVKMCEFHSRKSLIIKYFRGTFDVFQLEFEGCVKHFERRHDWNMFHALQCNSNKFRFLSVTHLTVFTHGSPRDERRAEMGIVSLIFCQRKPTTVKHVCNVTKTLRNLA